MEIYLQKNVKFVPQDAIFVLGLIQQIAFI